MERFIEVVKRHRCLWDMEDCAYKDFEMMDRAWVKVARETGFADAKSAKVQWKKLRDNFREALKRKKESKNGGRTWRYQHQMEFLIPFMQSKNQDFSASEMFQRDESNDTNHLLDNDESKPDVEVSLEEEATDSALPFFSKRRKLTVSSPYLDDPKEDKDLTTRTSVSSGNALQDFFSSMYNTTEELPLHLQLQVKRKIFETVAEAEEAALLLQQPQQQEYNAQLFLT